MRPSLGRRYGTLKPATILLSTGLVVTNTLRRRLSLSSSSVSSSASPLSSVSLQQILGDPSTSSNRATAPLLTTAYDYDVIVIGGGSGGLACSREIAAYGGKVALLDYVTPSPQGTTWGLGGTCVNVGCIPKKLMHTAALLGENVRHDSQEYGWQIPTSGTVVSSSSSTSSSSSSPSSTDTRTSQYPHSWSTMAGNIRSYIKGMNWGYKNTLKDERVDYINGNGKLIDPHTVEYMDNKGNTFRRTAAHIVLAVGGRPKYPENVPGAKEYGITSDDLFWLRQPPGRTLLVGAGYVALECAGFLTGIGYSTSVMARGQILRGFDRQIAEKITSHMEMTGTRILRDAVPVKLEPVDSSTTEATPSSNTKPLRKIKVTWKQTVNGKEEHTNEIFDTVIFATGRYPVTQTLGLEKVGVKTDATGKIIGNGGALSSTVGTLVNNGNGNGNGNDATGNVLQVQHTSLTIHAETTSVPSIHAIGDILSGKPELTPVAIRAGKLLAYRIMKGLIPTEKSIVPVASQSSSFSPKLSTVCMDYANIPTTIFTPMEYGCVGLSEEQALQQYGEENIEVYHLAYDTLELALAHRLDKQNLPLLPQCYSKLITTRGKDNDPYTQKVLGMHVLGPHAGEVIQGFAVALRLGVTKGDLDSTIGIHPTHAEELVQLDRTKRSGESYVKTSC